MPLRSLFTSCLIAAALAASLHAENADELRQKGVDALNDSQTNPRSIVDAARYFAKAADAYEKAGEQEKNVEMNSFLYWCKKKMTIDDIDAFTKGGETEVVNTLNAVAEKKVDANEAQAWFDRAEKFAAAKPEEHLLIAIRFYEVADRFKGTDLSLKAQDKSLNEQTLAQGTKRPPKSAPPVATNTDAAQARPKVDVPDAAKQKEVEKELKNILKDDYAKTARPEDRLALSKKLLTMAEEAGDDAATRYIELRDAKDMAAASGDLTQTLKAISKFSKSFNVDTVAIKSAAFKTLLEFSKTKEPAKALTESILEAVEDGISTDQFTALRAMVSLAETSAARAQVPLLTARVKDKAAHLDELIREWPAAKTAIEKAADLKQAAACLTAGRFVCLLKGDFEHGLPFLANCPDPVLKKLATDDQADPAETAGQLLVADVWFDLGEKEKAKYAGRGMLGRAGFWYTKAQPMLSGLNKARVDKRLEQIAAAGISISMPKSAFAGKWSVTWPSHPEYGKRACEFMGDGTIKVGPKENFGAYVPAKWSVKNNAVMIEFKNGSATRYTIIDETTLAQADGGDGRYTKQVK